MQNRTVPTHPDPADVWPDVIASGGLAAALAAAIAAEGLDAPVPVASTSVYRALVPAVVPHRRALEVSASHVERLVHPGPAIAPRTRP
jgi:hypothetical protein